MYKPHIHPPQPPAASSSASRSGVQPLMQLTPLVLAPARSFKPKPWSPPGLNRQEGSASAAAEGSSSSCAKLRAEPLSSALGKRATPVLAMTPKRFVACFRSGTTGRASKNARTPILLRLDFLSSLCASSLSSFALFLFLTRFPFFLFSRVAV